MMLWVFHGPCTLYMHCVKLTLIVCLLAGALSYHWFQLGQGLDEHDWLSDGWVPWWRESCTAWGTWNHHLAGGWFHSYLCCETTRNEKTQVVFAGLISHNNNNDNDNKWISIEQHLTQQGWAHHSWQVQWQINKCRPHSVEPNENSAIYKGKGHYWDKNVSIKACWWLGHSAQLNKHSALYKYKQDYWEWNVNTKASWWLGHSAQLNKHSAFYKYKQDYWE